MPKDPRVLDDQEGGAVPDVSSELDGGRSGINSNCGGGTIYELGDWCKTRTTLSDSQSTLRSASSVSSQPYSSENDARGSALKASEAV